MSELENTIFERESEIRRRISEAFKHEFEITESSAQDIGFHMTDWLGDVERLINTYSQIQHLTNNEICSFVIQFLAHVPAHLNAATKLTGLGPIVDVFELGIFDEDE